MMSRGNRPRGFARKYHKKVVVIVDGKTEIWYLQLLKKHENLNKVSIKPELPKKRKLADIFKMLNDLSNHYDTVVWIVDFDTIITEDRERKAGEKSKIAEFREYYKSLMGMKNVYVFVNTPCLEFWYLQHFKETAKFFNKCENVADEFKGSVLNDYKKSEKYYKKKNNDIYQKLKPLQETAKQRSKNLGIFDPENPETAKAGIYEIFELLEVIK